MIAFAGMLVPAAERAGIKVPPDPDDFNPNEYPHFEVFCAMQLGQPMPNWTCHWDNAKVVAEIPEKDIRHVTPGDLINKGFQVGCSIP